MEAGEAVGARETTGAGEADGVGETTGAGGATGAGANGPRRRLGLPAAVLNVSGLGVGYLYLRRWWWALGHGVLLAAWVVSASSTAAWLVGLAALVGVSVVAAAFFGWRSAGRRPLMPSAWIPVTAAVLLAGAVAVLVSEYRGDARAELAAAERAHADGDCKAAIRHYDRVTGLYRRSFTTAVEQAPAGRRACRDLEAARRQAADEDFEAAIPAYQDYVGEREALFAEGAAAELAAFRAAYAELIVDSADGELSRYADAYQQYVLLVEEQPDSPEAEAASDAVEEMLETATAGLGRDEACTEVEVLEFFADELPGDDGLSDEAVESAEDALPDAEEACEEQMVEETIEDLADDADFLPSPTEVGTTAGRSVTLEIVNQSDQTLELLYTGPETGRIEVPPCTSCATVGGPTPTSFPTTTTMPGSSAPSDCGAAASPRRRVTLDAGSYEVVVRTSGDEVVTPFYGTWDLARGTTYSACYYLQPAFG